MQSRRARDRSASTHTQLHLATKDLGVGFRTDLADGLRSRAAASATAALARLRLAQVRCNESIARLASSLAFQWSAAIEAAIYTCTRSDCCRRRRLQARGFSRS
jgi:hypothetical protein